MIHTIPNSMQPLHGLSHLEIIFWRAQSHMSFEAFDFRTGGLNLLERFGSL